MEVVFLLKLNDLSVISRGLLKHYVLMRGIRMDVGLRYVGGLLGLVWEVGSMIKWKASRLKGVKRDIFGVKDSFSRFYSSMKDVLDRLWWVAIGFIGVQWFIMKLGVVGGDSRWFTEYDSPKNVNNDFGFVSPSSQVLARGGCSLGVEYDLVGLI
ncbi:hypothetical protein Tco_0381452 [Tanacetum coccineum]